MTTPTHPIINQLQQDLNQPQQPTLGGEAVPKTTTAGDDSTTGEIMMKGHKVTRPSKNPLQWFKAASQIQQPGMRVIDKEELKLHNSPESCWAVYKNVVYDVTGYIPYHVGGPGCLLASGGADMTAAVQRVHKWVSIEGMMDKCKIGVLKDDKQQYLAPSNVFKLPKKKFDALEKSEESEDQ